MTAWRIVFTVYIVGIHAALAITLITSDFVYRVERRIGFGIPPAQSQNVISMRIHQRQADNLVPDGATIFIGDSIVQFMPPPHGIGESVNFGIGGQRSDQLIDTMEIYGSIKRAKRVVVMVGANDLLQGRKSRLEANYSTILDRIPPGVEVIMSGLHPMSHPNLYGYTVTAEDIKESSAAALHACQRRAHCKFVDSFAALAPIAILDADTLLPDGIHLSTKGYRIWIDALKRAMQS